MDVGAWLSNLGLEQYEAAFRDNSVDADVLPRLTGEDLGCYPGTGDFIDFRAEIGDSSDSGSRDADFP
jgi:hypothetical protein